jgi:hypothetical protein
LGGFSAAERGAFDHNHHPAPDLGMDRMGMDRGGVSGGGVGGMDRMDRMMDRGGGGVGVGGGPMMDRSGLDRPMMMDRTGGGGGGPHARSRSASRGFPSRTAGPAGPGYHSLDRDRDGYGTDRDGSFMPIDRPRERSLDRGLVGGGMDYGGGGGPPYGSGGGYGRRDRSLDRGRDPMLDPDDGLYTGRGGVGGDMVGPVHRSTRLSPNPVSLQRDAYIR